MIPRSKQYEDALREDLCAMFLAGVSTRTLSLMSERLIGRKISPMEVSNASKELSRAVEAWRERDLSAESIKYMYVDGTLFSMRIDGSVEQGACSGGHRGDRGRVPNGSGRAVRRQGIGLHVAGAFQGHQATRVWIPARVVLGIMDGLPGLEKVFLEEFPNAKVQRCQIHVARNVLAKVPRKLKKDHCR